MKPLVYAQPANGITDAEHHVFRAAKASYAGQPTELTPDERTSNGLLRADT